MADFFPPRLPLEHDLLSLELDSSESLPNWDTERLEVLLLLDSLVDDLPEDLPEDSSITSSFGFFFFFCLSVFSLASFPSPWLLWVSHGNRELFLLTLLLPSCTGPWG
jgi:hypothetical protein